MYGLPTNVSENSYGPRLFTLVAKGSPAADLLEDQGVAFAEARMLEWTARLMRRAASLATTFPERWRVHFERAWRGVAAAVAREYDGATLSLEVRDGNPRGEGKITVGPKVGGWFS